MNEKLAEEVRRIALRQILESLRKSAVAEVELSQEKKIEDVEELLQRALRKIGVGE